MLVFSQCFLTECRFIPPTAPALPSKVKSPHKLFIQLFLIKRLPASDPPSLAGSRLTLYLFLYILFLHIHQDNIISDLADIAKGNDILLFPPPKTAHATGPRNDQS